MWKIRLIILGYGAVAATLNAREREGIAIACGLGAIVVPWALGRYARRVARQIDEDYARTIALLRRPAAERPPPPARSRRPSASK